MPDLSFAIDSAKVVPFAATPMLAFQLSIRNAAADERIHTIALRCQIQIEVTRRQYASQEQERLLDLFGTPGPLEPNTAHLAVDPCANGCSRI